MTQEEIIAMARQSDIIDFRDADDDPHTAQMVDFLERFAALVAAKEREACAAICRAKAAAARGGNPVASSHELEGEALALEECAEEISARGGT